LPHVNGLAAAPTVKCGMDADQAQQLLKQSYAAAVAAADPLQIVPAHLPPPPKGRTLVVGAGKAGASMAKAVEQHWPAGAPLEGLMITRYAHGYSGEEALKRIRVIEAGHPVPDESGEAAAREIMRLVQGLGPDDLLLALVSGGGSALLSLPAETISMADLKATTRELLRCGAPIQDMNTVRKHLSLIQGGKLAAMCKAPILSLVISDVTGDAPTHIASGPTVPDPTTYQDALDILAKFECQVPASVRKHLDAGARGEIAETPKPGSTVFARADTRVIATAHKSLEAAAEVFRAAGVTPVLLGDTVTGEAREAAKVHAALAREIAQYGAPFKPPLALISGGECTVTVKNPNGRGGRCAEYLLSMAIELEGMPNAWGLAADTDGIDGSEPNAGALFGPDALARAAQSGMRGDKMLEANDAYGFFDTTGGLIVTGPTRTNVNDYRALLLGA
jgi:hydroxypyruvate reductase